MLFKQKVLEGLKSGNISLAFRKWERASVKKGTVIKTAIGLIAVIDVEEIHQRELLLEDAVSAGYEQLEPLIKELNKNNGKLYKISITYAGEDPRIPLREKVDLSGKEFAILKKQVERLDQYSRNGHWTIKVLQTIKENPRLRAVDLALKTGKSKEWLKLNIRKLKNLGLTISHDTGYTLSPLGEFFLSKISDVSNSTFDATN